MALTTKFVIPVLLMTALGAGAALTGCVTTTSGPVSDSTSSSAAKNGTVDNGLPKDVPYIPHTDAPTSTANDFTKQYTAAFSTNSADAVKEAGDLLVSKGYTSKGSGTYSNTKHEITLTGAKGDVKYRISVK